MGKELGGKGFMTKEDVDLRSENRVANKDFPKATHSWL